MNDFDEGPSFGEYEETYGLLDTEDLITRDTMWTTKEGRRVAIKDMGDTHLLNTIRVLRNISPIGTAFKTSEERRRDWANAMANEAYSRGLRIDEVEQEKHVHE